VRRVLVVEDNALNRELLRAVLEGAGWEVDEAENGLDALAVLTQRLPDVVLADLQMPTMGGSAFLRELRKHPRLAGLKVCAVTAYAMRGDRERALAEGFDGYITKPIQVNELRAQIDRLFAACAAEQGERF
jgi:CheY-like chemotaxis protein